MRIVLAAGVALGVLSRIEEVEAALDAGVSTNFTWLAVAFLVGGALRGAVALTAANAAYYAWILITEPGRELASVAGPPEGWLALGVAGGLVFGFAGSFLRSPTAAVRLASLTPLAALLVAEQVEPLSRLLP